MVTDERFALIKEVLPRTLRSLFLLRITFCTLAALLALVKTTISPPLSTFFIDVLSETLPGLESWVRALNLLVSGLLAAALALVVTTLLIQARLKTEAERDNAPDTGE